MPCPQCFAPDELIIGGKCDSCGRKSEEPPRNMMREALQLIEESQRIMLSAAHTLCPVYGACPEYEATLKMYDKIKDHWHKVNRKASHLQKKHATVDVVNS